MTTGPAMTCLILSTCGQRWTELFSREEAWPDLEPELSARAVVPSLQWRDVHQASSSKRVLFVRSKQM